MRELVLDPAGRDERRIPIGGGLVLGRDPACDVVVDHPSLSRRHVRVWQDGEGAWVEDLGSKNGTRVGGTRIRGPTRAGDGEALVLGEVPATIGERAPEVLATRSVSRDVSILGVPVPRAADPAERLATLLEVSRVLARPGPALLDTLTDLARRVFGVDRAVLLLDDEVRPAGSAFSRTIVDWTRAHGVAALFVDAATDPRSADAASVHALAIRSSMAAPLLVGGRVAGVLYLDERRAGQRFAEADLELLAAFADQASMALENVRLRRQLEEEAARRSTLQRFFPEATLGVLLASGGEVPTAETEVTALFCDLADYTRVAGGMAPLDVIRMLNRYFSVVAPIVFAHGGTLEKYVGDAVLAVWGAPVRRPDDADRAVRAALALPAAVRAIPADGHPALRVHVGVHSGRVAAGNVGSREYLQYATIGDATNVAARVCAAAGADEVLISDATWSRLAQRPPARRLDGMTVKGKDEPLTLWRAG